MSREAKKVCTACARALPLAEFSRDVSQRDGLSRLCRPCFAAMRREQIARRAAGQARPRGKPSKIAPGEVAHVAPFRTTPRIALIRYLDAKAQYDAERAAR